jgi:DNA polymerase-1
MSNPILLAGERQTQSVFAVIQKVQNVVAQHPNANIIVLWDGKSWRKDIYTEYKANRGKTEKEQAARAAYFDQKTEIMKGLELLGVRQMWGTNMEADDLAGLLTEKLASKGKITLMTADKDWQQLVAPNVIWHDVINSRLCDAASFKTVTGFNDREQFLEAKCILGDAGDNIKGIMGVGPKAVEGIYKMSDDFESFLYCLRDYPDELMIRWKQTIGKIMPKALRELDVPSAWNQFEFNMELVDLNTKARPTIAKMIDDKGRLDLDKFKEFCHKNAFSSIVRRFDQFVEAFQQNAYITK